MNYPKTKEEVINRLIANPQINRNFIRALAYENGIDQDDKYDQSFGRAEIAIEKENNPEKNEISH